MLFGWLYMLSYLLLLSWTATAEQFYVLPSDSTSCPRKPCYTLTDIVLNSSRYFASNTVITFLPGNHKTNITRNLPVLIMDVRNISMIGYDHTNTNSKSVIQCTGPLGFAFINVTTLKITSLRFVSCGAFISSEFTVEENVVYPRDFETFIQKTKVTIYLKQTTNTTISEVAISLSAGAGLLGINIIGHSNISQSTFHHNKPNCLIIFLDLPSTSPSTALNIEDSYLAFGMPPNHSKKVEWSATGLCIVLTQIAYRVHIYASNVTTYNNLKWLITGNLCFYIENWECHCSVILAKQILSSNKIEGWDQNLIRIKPRYNPHPCSCSKPPKEEYTVYISDISFFKVGLSINSEEKYCHFRIRLQNITMQKSKPFALYIIGMRSMEIQNVKLAYNYRKVFIQYSKITATGECHFIYNKGYPSAIYLDNSTISFDGEVKFIGNNDKFNPNTFKLPPIRSKVHWAAVILTNKSTMKFHQKAEIVRNGGSIGGAIILYGSSQLIVGATSNVSFLRNYAQEYGGAILVDKSTIVVESEAKMKFTENTAYNGGAIAMQNGARIILKSHSQITFERNHAQQYGGALFVDEPTLDSIFIYDRYSIKCFFELSSQLEATSSFVFVNNTADSAGSILYGGWVEFCINNRGEPGALAFNETFHFQEVQSAVSSNPTRVCVCINDTPDCSITQYNVTAYPGETFQIPAVAVGQMLGTVPFTVKSKFTAVNFKSRSQLKPLQKTQSVRRTCTSLTYTIISSHKSESLILTVDKLDKQVTHVLLQYKNKNKLPLILKDLHLHIQLNPCPLGFVLDNSSCICHPQLQQHGINCNIDTQKVDRKSSVWINVTFTNGSQKGVLVHEHCPFDYCKPESLALDMEDPDEQCAFNRSGILCGACQNNLSHVFGTSACRECASLWALLWVPLIALAGIALVVLLIVLNLTVSVGTINGLIFYTNIVRANHATFFPPNTTNSFLSWFIAWINLDLGIETCFYNGLDAYVKRWLQFVFPLYIWFLVIAIIVVSHYYTLAARLSGRNAVPVLATLFLISYAKLLRIIITVFQSTNLEYPDSTVRKVWLYDGNTNYLKGKHIPLFIAALLLLLISLPYTAILIFIQYLQHWSSYRVLFWVKKLKPLFDAYTGPYKDNHRYWTGLLLLVRIVLFLIFSVNIRESADINLLAIIVTVLLLLALAGSVYKRWYLNVIEYSFLLNLGVLAAATFHTTVSGQGQTTVVYTSVSIAFAIFIIIVVLHMCMKFKYSRLTSRTSANLLKKVKPKASELISAVRKPCYKLRKHSNIQPGVSHNSVELRESLLEYCSQ